MLGSCESEEPSTDGNAIFVATCCFAVAVATGPTTAFVFASPPKKPPTGDSISFKTGPSCINSAPLPISEFKKSCASVSSTKMYLPFDNLYLGILYYFYYFGL